MQINTQSFIELIVLLNTIWAAPLQIIISIVIIWNYLGVASLVGLGILCLFIPLNIFLANLSKKYRIQKLKQQDTRLKLISDVLNEISKDHGFNIDKSLSEDLKVNKHIDKKIEIKNEKFTDLALFSAVGAAIMGGIYLFRSGTKSVDSKNNSLDKRKYTNKIEYNKTLKQNEMIDVYLLDLYEDSDYLTLEEQSFANQEDLIKTRKNELNLNIYTNLPSKIKNSLNSLHKLSPIKSNVIKLPIEIYRKIKIRPKNQKNLKTELHAGGKKKILITESIFNKDKFY
jgi:hypothetical protein